MMVNCRVSSNIVKGDILICYMTRVSRFFSLFEITDKYFIDSKPIFANNEDPYIIRFKVKPLVIFDIEHSIPIFDDLLWEKLSFTKKRSWTAMVRSSLREIQKEDGDLLKTVLLDQKTKNKVYKLSDADIRKLKQKQQKIKSSESIINVSVPEDDEELKKKRQ
jgi:hypothetical protein